MASSDPKDLLDGLDEPEDSSDSSDDSGDDSVAAMADFLEACGLDSSKAVAADKAMKAWLALADQS